jgi:1-phosphofructokinase
MITTVTLNPSLDRTIEVDTLERGEVMRTAPSRKEPGGKGVNVTRALAANSFASTALLPIGGRDGDEVRGLLSQAGIAACFVPVSAATRSNVAVAESDGTVTKFNEPGSALRDEEIASLLTELDRLIAPGDWVVLSGSVPPGFASETIGDIARMVAASGANFAVDSSGSALLAALDHRPKLIKPNRSELSELIGRPVASITDVIVASHALCARGVEIVLTSLGADGAVLVTEHETLVGESRVEHPLSTVGAGDSFLAGFLSAVSTDATDLSSALVRALAWGAAATGLPGSAVPGPKDIDLSRVGLVEQPDLLRPLVAS